MARPASKQDITARDMAIHGRGCGHASMELSVVIYVPMFKTAVVICLFNCLVALEAKCHPSNGSNFIVRFMTCMLAT